jgi:RNA polymerase sigma-70 factor (ECF subfamily)
MSRRDDETRAAFKQTALVHLRELVRMATRLSGDRAVGGDLAQETFLQAWKSFHRFRDGTNCRAWLYKILFYVVSQHRRKAQRELALVDLERLPDDVLSFDPLTPDVLARNQVLAAFQRLSEPYRVVVVLADVEELTYREIASALAVPVGTVMSRLNRARKMLRRELAAQAEAFGLESRAKGSA